MSTNDNTPSPGAADVITAALTAAGFQPSEAGAILDQAAAARAAAAQSRPGTPAAVVSTPAGVAAAKSYTVAELAGIRDALGLGGSNPAASPAPPAGPPITSRGSPPPSSTPSENTPILRMAPADQKALLDDLVRKHGFVEGNSMFAERHARELASRNTRVRPQGR